MSRSHQYVALHAYHGMQRPGGTGGQGSLGPKPPPWSKGGRASGGGGSSIVYDAIDYDYTAIGNITMNLMQGVAVSPDGTSVLGCQAQAGSQIRQWTLSTPYDITTMTDQTDVLNLANSYGLQWAVDGTKLFVLQDNGAAELVNGYSCPTPYSAVGATLDGVKDVGAQDAGPNGLTVKPDGSRLYWVDGPHLYEYSMTAGDIDTLVYLNHFQTTTDSFNQGIFVSEDGLRWMSSASGTWKSWNMSTAWDISTTSGTPDSAKNATNGNNNMGDCCIAGDHMYIADTLDDVIYQYTRVA